MRRTGADISLMKQFGGIQEVGEDFADRIDEIHGMYDKSVTALERIPGKLLSTTGLASGPVWGIFQLRFRDRIQMLTHSGPSLQASLETISLPGQYFDLPSYPFPEEVPIGEPPWASDWPIKSSGIQADIAGWTQGNQTAQQNVSVPQSETGTATVHDGDGYLTVDPTSLDFSINDGSGWTDAQDLDLVTHIEGFWLKGFCLVKVTWDKDYLIVMDGSFPVTNGEIVSTIWENDYREAFSVAIDPNTVPPSDEAGEVVFTAVDGYINPKTLLDSSGNDIVAVLLLDVTSRVTLELSFENTYPNANPIQTGPYLWRGHEFNLIIQASSPDYAPSAPLIISDTDTDGVLTPVSTDASGWVAGRKAVPCTISGGLTDLSDTLSVVDADYGTFNLTEYLYPCLQIHWTGGAVGPYTSPAIPFWVYWDGTVDWGISRVWGAGTLAAIIYYDVANVRWVVWFVTTPPVVTQSLYVMASGDSSRAGAIGAYVYNTGANIGAVTVTGT